jgi:hypothetical protein
MAYVWIRCPGKGFKLTWPAAQRAIATVVRSTVYAGELRGTVEEAVLRQQALVLPEPR